MLHSHPNWKRYANEVCSTEAVSASSTPPVIGTAPTAASSSSASLEMPPVTAATSEDFHVPNTNTTLSIRYKPQNPILSVAMSGILDDAKNDLEQKMDKDGDGWISTSRWTYVKAAYDCVISAEERPEPGPTGLPQHLTYGILQVTMLGLRAALFDKGLYHGADFDIWDQQWGWVASGAISSWTLGVENVAQS